MQESMQPGTAKTLRLIIDAALRGEPDEAAARRLHALEPQAVALAMLVASRHIAEQDARLTQLTDRVPAPNPSPSTPSPTGSEPTSPPARLRGALLLLTSGIIVTMKPLIRKTRRGQDTAQEQWHTPMFLWGRQCHAACEPDTTNQFLHRRAALPSSFPEEFIPLAVLGVPRCGKCSP